MKKTVRKAKITIKMNNLNKKDIKHHCRGKNWQSMRTLENVLVVENNTIIYK